MNDSVTFTVAGSTAREILDSLAEGCQIIGFDFRFRYVNDSFLSQTQLQKEHLLGRTMMECFPGIESTEFFSLLDRSMSERIPQRMESAFLLPAATGGWFEVRLAPVPEGVCILSANLSHRNRTEASLRELEAQFGVLYDSIADPTFLLAAEPGGAFRFLSINRAFLGATGLHAEQVIGRPVEEVLPPTSLALVLPRYLQAITERRRVTWEETAEYPAGTKVAAVTVTPLSGQADRCTHLIGSVHDMTGQKEAERALLKSEREFRAIFNQAPLGVAIINSATGQFRRVNHQYCTIAGYPESELLALTFQDITHPGDLQCDLDQMQQLMDGSVRTFQMEKRYIRKDGSVVWVSLTCVPLWDGPGGTLQHIAMIDDITERKKAEERLVESELKYRVLVEHANSIILRSTARGQIIFLNEFGQRFFGYAEQEILGSHVIGTIVPPDGESTAELRRMMEQIGAEPGAFEQRISENMCRDGRRVWISWANRIDRDAEGRVIEILSVGTDITARRQAEQEITRLNQNLQRHAAELELRVAERTAELAVARDRAEAADHLKSAFLATMSHELRTPLNSIIGFTGIVLRGLAGPLTAEQTKQLGMVRGSARHLLDLINDVLDISKIEAGELTVRSEPVDLYAAVAKTAGMVKPLAERKGLLLGIHVTPGLGQVFADERRVQQVLLNLLTNAVKFTERGEVTLTLEATPDVVHVRVADTGIGIKPEDLAIVFQPFRQIDSGTARNHEGTGLGLAICRRLAELMGGEIRATSELGKGSVFTFSIPTGEPRHP
jgi:PAS domain S-box-containing protein